MTQVMSSTALTLNLLVAGIAFVAYYLARHFTPRLLRPFLLTSIPAAFLGGFVRLSADAYLILLYASLSCVALRMLFRGNPPAEKSTICTFPPAIALAAGGLIGLLSGMIGIGGGIFRRLTTRSTPARQRAGAHVSHPGRV